MEAIDLTGGDIDRIIQQLGRLQPASSARSQQIKSVFAAEACSPSISAETGFGDNLSVIETSGGFDITSSAAKAELQKQIEAIGGKNVDFATQTIHGRKVLTAGVRACDHATPTAQR